MLLLWRRPALWQRSSAQLQYMLSPRSSSLAPAGSRAVVKGGKSSLLRAYTDDPGLKVTPVSARKMRSP